MSRAVASALSGKTQIQSDRFYIGDCLPVLANLKARHGQFADLVYLDPPFNSQRQYNHAFEGKFRTVTEKVAFHDTWKWTPDTQAALDKFVEAEAPDTRAAAFVKAMWGFLRAPGHSSRKEQATLAYLLYMTRRLYVIRAVMKETASVYLHCDATASHYLKLAMDAVFGPGNFRNDIVWKKYSGRKNNATRKFFTQNDNLFFYVKSNAARFRPLFMPLSDKEVERKYRHMDERGRRYRLAWGRKYQTQKEQRRIYLTDEDGRRREAAVGNLWVEDGLQLNTSSSERLGYETQKPLSLLRRVVAASSEANDLVLDPFCGCGTTIAACHELDRRFIGVDIARSAAQVVARRMQDKYDDFGKLQIGGRTPKTFAGWAKQLPDDKPDDVPAWARFQYDAIAAIPKAVQVEGKIQKTPRLGADGGIDGLLHVRRPNGMLGSIVIQVKQKKQSSMADVNDTLAAVANNKAVMGLLITLAKPTAEMVSRGSQRTHRFGDKSYPEVAVLTYEEVKAGGFREALPYEHAVDPQEGSQTKLGLRRRRKAKPPRE